LVFSYQFFSPMCETDPAVQLIANPTGGTFYVNGVVQAMFDPSVIGPGTHTIVYVYNPPIGCLRMDTTYMIVVPTNNQVVYNEVNITPCISYPAYVLTQGTPVGGTYSGAGVIGNMFDPGIAGLGLHPVYYSFQGCGGADTSIINVVTSPVIASLTLNPNSVCLNLPAFALSGGLPAGGTYSGPGVNNGNFNPATAGLGNKLITYSYTDPNSGCTDAAYKLMTVTTCDVSIDELNYPNNLRIVYLSVSEQISVSSTKIISSIELMDISGKKIASANAVSSNYSISVNGIPNGVYFVKVVYNEQSVEVKKFVKL